MLPTPVLLPGNMCDARLWRGGNGVVIERLKQLGFPAVVDADLAPDATIATMAARTLLATTGPLLLIGFSMGAIVAVEMAVQSPERIVGLILAGYNATADLPERAIHRPVQQAEVRDGGLERILIEELKPNYLAMQNRSDHGLLNLLRAMGMGLGADVFIRQSEALRLRADRRPALALINVPVLYVCGSEDTLCPPEWHEQWQRMTPHARISIFESAGHMLPLEAPEALAAGMADWINDNRGTVFS